MKLTFDKLFGSALEGVRLFILYGNDDAVIQRAIDYIQYRNSALKLTFLETLESAASHEPSLFESDPQAQLNIYRTSSEKIIQSLDLSGNSKWLIIAPNLRAKSPVIMNAGNQPQWAAISCYESALVPHELMALAQKNNLTLTQDQLRTLHQHFRNDVPQLQDFLGILSYCSPLKSSDFEAFLKQYTSQTEGASLVSALLLKDQVGFLKSAEMNLDQETLIPVLRSLARTFEILLSKKSGLKTLPYAVFFKDEPFYERALKVWTLPQIQEFLKLLLNLEHDVKFKQFSSFVAIQELNQKCFT